MDTDVSVQARIAPDDSDQAGWLGLTRRTRVATGSGRTGWLGRLGSSWLTRIDLADSDRDCIWLSRLTRIW